MDNRAEYFFAITTLGSFSAAAEKLHVSQPYLSQYISNLEHQLDVKLFDKAKKPIRLTKAGTVYYQYLKDIVALQQNLAADLNALNNQRSSTLQLGFGPWRGSVMLPYILPLFLKEYPNTNIVLHEHLINETTSLLKEGIIDVAIVNPSIIVPGDIATELICNEKIMLVANRNNHKTKELSEKIKHKDVKPLRVIANERFILLNRGLLASEMVHNYLRKYGIVPGKRIMTTNSTTAVNLVAENLGFAFILETGVKKASQNNDLLFFDLETEDLNVPLVALYKKNIPLSVASRRFIDMLAMSVSQRRSNLTAK